MEAEDPDGYHYCAWDYLEKNTREPCGIIILPGQASPNIKSLSFKKCADVIAEGAKAFANMGLSKLAHLNLEGCAFSSGSSFAGINATVC
ncbi:hypothetical protein E2562_020583 [Oryza meyeriana var. granulata]|uniref:Uncharacterized protein n=1 Tax=Oryza meyeriana var. granulata TaxID=110450 RepID=A0A6G1DYB6_9ORYZ|nr:hypothetical protein E2562_020583 [Oryza meyeriana var. granulata]